MKRTGIWTSLILSVVAAAPAFAAPDSQHNEKTSIVVEEDGKNIEITIHGDKVVAKVDGLKISPDHVRREGNRIVLLDKDGEPMEHIVIGVPPEVPHVPGTDNSPMNMKVVSADRPPVMLGILMDAPDEALRSQLGVNENAALIEKVMDDLPASKAGLEPWDIIVEVDGEPLDEPGELHKILMQSKPGDDLGVVVIRHAERQKLTIKLEAYDAEALEKHEIESPGWFGDRTGFFDPQPLIQQLEKQLSKVNTPEARRQIEEARKQIENARRQIEEAKRDLLSGDNWFSGLRWTFDDHGRLVRPNYPGNNRRDEMADKFEQRLDDLEEEFSDRLERLENRWGDMEKMFDRLLSRLDEVINDHERRDEYDDDQDDD